MQSRLVTERSRQKRFTILLAMDRHVIQPRRPTVAQVTLDADLIELQSAHAIPPDCLRLEHLGHEQAARRGSEFC